MDDLVDLDEPMADTSYTLREALNSHLQEAMLDAKYGNKTKRNKMMPDESPEDDINPPIEVLVEDGDLLIIVHNINADYQPKRLPYSRHQAHLVDSRVISRASAKWKELVLDTSDEIGQISIEVTGELEHHEMLFAIMHSKFDHVSKPEDEYALFSLVKFTQEWGVTYLLRPWVEAWISPYTELPDLYYEWRHYTDIENILMRLWTAWTFGQHGIFRWLTKLLVKEVHIDNESELSFGGLPLSQQFGRFGVPEIPGLLGT